MCAEILTHGTHTLKVHADDCGREQYLPRRNWGKPTSTGNQTHTLELGG